MSLPQQKAGVAFDMDLPWASGGDDTVVWYTLADGTVEQPNPSWRAFTGQTHAESEGMGWMEVVHPQDRAAVRQQWMQAARSAEPMTLRYRLRHRDGDYRHVVAQSAPVFVAGVLTQWVGFMIDTTESQRAAAALKVNEERLRVLDDIGQATRHLRDADSIMAVTTRLLGRSLCATRCAYADVESDGDAFTIRSDWAEEGVASSAGTYSLALFGPQATTHLRQGRHLVVHDVDRELGDDSGGRMFNAIGIKAIVCAGLVKEDRLVAMMAVHQSTPRHWTSDELDTISEVVDRCWAHIERVRDAARLREQHARKDEFIATLAHELRNPLAPIKYAVAIAGRYPVSPEVVRQLGVVDRQVSLMARLIDDLLDVSRINRGLIELRREEADLAVLVARAVESAQSLIDTRAHRVEVRVPPGLQVHVDPARMVQVIGNLLTNAAKYTPRGGRIEVESSVQGGEVMLRVTDNGYGIPKSDVGRLFQMFTQLPHTTPHAQGGLGLGLAVIRKLMALHGGRVEATSPGLDQGSTFTVTLPMRRPIAPAMNEPRIGAGPEPSPVPAPLPVPVPVSNPPHRPPGTVRRVLVVEDNDDGRECLVALLQGMEFEVTGVANGPDALAAVAQAAPHVVLLDLGLPGMDGYQVAQALRRTHGPDRMALLALTGWGAARDIGRTQAAGFDQHLTKPVETASLAQAIHRALRRLAQADEDPTRV